LFAALVLATACATRPAPAQDPVPVEADSLGSSMIPPGEGQLRQDVITIGLRSGTIELRFTPLDERVTRLLAPDAYQSLQVLLSRHAQALDSAVARLGIRTPGIAMVSFHGLAPGSRFDPQLLTLTVHNQRMSPAGVIPLSATFSAQQLDVRDQAIGLFLFDELIPVTEPFTLGYLDANSSDWERRLNRLERERARIRAKAGLGGGSAGESR
jgi:hypothetical protein